MPDPILAIDAGTTGVTSILFDADLEPRAKAYREFEQGFPRPGWVEHEAGAILAAVDATTAEVLAGVPALSAVGITNQRETIFALDRSSGEALGTGIVWQDRRTAERCRELAAAGHGPDVRARTGLVLDPYFSATKAEWMLAERGEVRAAAQAGTLAFATVDALLVHHLTGGTRLATDPTNASRTMLFDIERRAWSPELGALFGIDESWLPEVVASSGDFGLARFGKLEAPIRGIAGDQQAALFGQGCWEEGGFKATYGTGSFLVLNTGERRVESERGLLTTLAAARDGSACFALEGSVFAAGVVIQWLRDQLGMLDEAQASEALARTVPDSGGVFFVPAFAGLGAPYWDPDARAGLFGLTRGSSRAHIARAALEGIAFQCAEIVELLRDETRLAVDELLVDGGASANDLLMQIQADVTGARVRRPANVEATARGAAALAGVGAGVWSDPAQAAAFSAPSATFEPTLDAAERAERLAGWRAAVARVRS